MCAIDHDAVTEEKLAKRIEKNVKKCLRNLNWDYSKNRPDPKCDPPPVAVVIASLARLAYDLLGEEDKKHRAKRKRKKKIRYGK